MVEVYLKMKNAIAEGRYDLKDGTINVFKGAKIEKNVTKSFEKKGYYELRKELQNKKIIVDLYFASNFKYINRTIF